MPPHVFKNGVIHPGYTTNTTPTTNLTKTSPWVVLTGLVGKAVDCELSAVMNKRNINFVQLHILYHQLTMAVVTSTILTIVRTDITLVSYFSNVTSFLTNLTLVRNFRLDDPVQWKWSQEHRQRG